MPKKARVCRTEGDVGESLIDEIAHEKAAPEEFLQQGDDNHETSETGDDGEPIERR